MYPNSYPYSSGSFTANPPLSVGMGRSEISFDTSSKEPSLLRSRVFVGKLNTNRVSRDEIIQLFRSYGALLGVTVFKGYAFVQYGSAPEADLAVSALNGYNWNGSVLDVKLSSAGQGGGVGGAAVGGISAKPSFSSQPQQQQYPKPSSSFGSYTKRGASGTSVGATGQVGEPMNAQNKKFASGLEAMPELAESHDSQPDTLICGECRTLFHTLRDFLHHRQVPCTFFKPEGEPVKLKCFTCAEEFANSWTLLTHLTSVHKLVLFKHCQPNSPPPNNNTDKIEGEAEEDEEEGIGNGKNGAESIAVAVAEAGVESETIAD